MKIILTFSILIISIRAVGQTQFEKDSLINVMCDVIIRTDGEPDSVRIQTVFVEHLYPFLNQYPEEQMDEIATNIYFRFQRNCPDFREALDRINPPAGDWETIAEKPSTRLNRKICEKFLQHKNYTYLETTGDTVKVNIENGIWTDKFIDGTYSKLKFSGVKNCEFVIEFLESDNYIRKSFSRQGDKYRYLIIDKKPGYYDMSVEIIGTDEYAIFKLYY